MINRTNSKVSRIIRPFLEKNPLKPEDRVTIVISFNTVDDISLTTFASLLTIDNFFTLERFRDAGIDFKSNQLVRSKNAIAKSVNGLQAPIEDLIEKLTVDAPSPEHVLTKMGMNRSAARDACRLLEINKLLIRR